METRILIQATEAAEMKKRCAKRLDALCRKYRVSEFDGQSFAVAVLFGRMETYESLCGKYGMSERDRNGLAGSLIMVLQIRRGKRMVWR